MNWLNEPTTWHKEGSTITATAAPKSDFWRRTQYGFIADNGHLYGQAASGDCIIEATINTEYLAQYDHAGLMLRLDEETWIKCGSEHVDGRDLVGAVVTRGYSDWSVTPLPQEHGPLRLRLAREGGTITFSWALGQDDWTVGRIAHLGEGPAIAGIMLASPQGEGFTASFTDLSITCT
jgi:regulation of enolase protein 1 (concanavalin A-like superfamily)